ncbi:hypothetical protein ACFLTT_02075 [Chloroflexota bacterium]
MDNLMLALGWASPIGIGIFIICLVGSISILSKMDKQKTEKGKNLQSVKEEITARIKTDQDFKTLFIQNAVQALSEYNLSREDIDSVVGHVVNLQQTELRSSSGDPEPPFCVWTAVC